MRDNFHNLNEKLVFANDKPNKKDYASKRLPYPLELASSGIWHSTEEKINVLKNLGIKKFSFYQTLIKNPMYTNEEPEEVSEGYKSGGYVAIIAEK